VRWRSLGRRKVTQPTSEPAARRDLPRSVRYRTDTAADPDHARLMQLKLPARPPLWLIAVSFCSLAVWGSVAILRSIPVSYANIPAEGTVSRHAALSDADADAHPNDTQSNLAVAPPTSKRVTCSECGVVESIREIARPEVVGRQDDVKLAPRVSGGGIVARTIVGKSYEITVRFRDGSTTVFNEAGARTWRMGSRVIMIGRSIASN
jgi:hypothetical protein